MGQVVVILDDWKIADWIVTEGVGSYFFEDLAAIRLQKISRVDKFFSGTSQDGKGKRVRTRASATIIGLKIYSELQGQSRTIWSECCPVSFVGASGRVEPWSISKVDSWIRDTLAPWLNQWLNQRVHKLNQTNCASELYAPLERDLAEFTNPLSGMQTESVPPYLRLGLSQLMVRLFEVCAVGLDVKDLFHGLSSRFESHEKNPIPLQGSSGADFTLAVLDMLDANIEYLPQGQFEDLSEQIGQDGAKLLVWVEWFKSQCERMKRVPTLTLDFHGGLDSVFNGNLGHIADFLVRLRVATAPLSLHCESVLSASSIDEYIQRMLELRVHLQKKGLISSKEFRLIADEWANTQSDIEQLSKSGCIDGIHLKMPDTGHFIEILHASQAIKDHGHFLLLGGSCTETLDQLNFAQDLAFVIRPDALLVKPGMGFNETWAYLKNRELRAQCRTLTAASRPE